MRALACLLVLSFSTTAWAIDRHTVLELRLFPYGDNTEFLFNPYRDGETILGASLRLDGALPVGATSVVRLGVQTDSRAGGDKAFQKVFPVIALEVGRTDNRFTMGTLHSGAFGRLPWQGLSPDQSGPHGLLPPLQLDTLAMGGYEAGLQWQRNGNHVEHDVWISWRRTNTATRREKFDVGLNGRAVIVRDLHGLVAFTAQGHIVHEGGQLTHVGSVGDSMAGGPGIVAERYVGPGTLRTEFSVLFSKHNPDRGDHARADHLTGRGLFVRMAYEAGDWRIAALGWRTQRPFIKWDGDPNYGALLNDVGPLPAVTLATRTYGELSLSRRFGLSDNAYLVTNGRLYRIDGSWDYAYRVSASVSFRHLVGGS